MSRSGYTDDFDDPLAMGRWRQAVTRALQGKRGQAMLRELAQALDEMPDKRLYAGNFATPEGEFCTLGVLGARRGLDMSDLGDEGDCEPRMVGQRFGIARAMAAEIMWLNDEAEDDDWGWMTFDLCGPVRRHWPDWGRHERTVRVQRPDGPERRWRRVRAWVAEQIARAEAGPKGGA